MRKSAVLMPLVALLAGVFGYLFRRIEVNTVIDSVTGLAARGAVVTNLLIVVTIAIILIMAVYAVMMFTRYRTERGYAKVFMPTGFVYIAGAYVVGIGWFIAAVLYVFNRSAVGGLTVIDWIFMLLAASSAVSVIVMSRGAYQRRSGTDMTLMSIIPPLFFCFWLIIYYKDNAANPVLLDYGYQILAIAAAALSYYYASGFTFRKVMTGKPIFAFLISIYLCIVVLADHTALSLKIMYAVTALNMLMSSILLIRNLDERYD